MAKNSDNDGKPLKPQKSVSTEGAFIDKLEDLKKRPKLLVASFIAIALIMLISFMMPDKEYTTGWNILFLNIELLILFGRDMWLYFAKSCKIIRITMILMTSIYVINIIDLWYDIPHTDYIMMSIGLISIVLGMIYFVGRR